MSWPTVIVLWAASCALGRGSASIEVRGGQGRANLP